MSGDSLPTTAREEGSTSREDRVEPGIPPPSIIQGENHNDY